jgi:chromosome segregation ATPase
MAELDQHIRRVSGKLQQLIRQHQQLLTENEQLKKQLSSANAKELEAKTKITELEQQILVLKAATGQLEAKDKLALEKNINKHLKEIDRCISFLSE